MEPNHRTVPRSRPGRLVIGLALVAVGVAILLETLLGDIPWRVVVSSALVLVGLVVLVRSRSGSAGGWVAVGTVMTVLLSVVLVVGQPLGGGAPNTIEQADFAVADPIDRIVVTVDAGPC